MGTPFVYNTTLNDLGLKYQNGYKIMVRYLFFKVTKCLVLLGT